LFDGETQFDEDFAWQADDGDVTAERDRGHFDRQRFASAGERAAQGSGDVLVSLRVWFRVAQPVDAPLLISCDVVEEVDCNSGPMSRLYASGAGAS
jgi:hypothetical protein